MILLKYLNENWKQELSVDKRMELLAKILGGIDKVTLYDLTYSHGKGEEEEITYNKPKEDEEVLQQKDIDDLEGLEDNI